MWPIFTPLWRTLSGGRSAPEVGSAALPFEANWTERFARLGLSSEDQRAIAASGVLHPHLRYRRFQKPKRAGGWRAIAEPDHRLKRLQHEIVSWCFSAERAHPAALAYQKGRSAADHIWAHAGAEIVVTADIRDFFPSTRAERIETWWRERTDGDTARLLTLLTAERGGLPQGAPTSPGLSNFVNTELDARLARHAAPSGARYTRYCDDLAFSWPIGSGVPSSFERGVRAALHEFGYTLHPDKGWRVSHRCDEPELVGAVLTRSGGVRLPDRLRRVIRGLTRSASPSDVQKLAGYRGYAAQVTNRPSRRTPKT